MSTLQTLLKGDVKLPTPPAIALRILEAVKKEDASFKELADITYADPALAARILKLANSSLYALPQKIGSIEKALSILGVDQLKNIALSFVIAQAIQGDSGGKFDFEFFWKRAITSAVGAELVASGIGKKNDDTFVSALLQDIGIPIMYLCRTVDYLKVLDEKKTTGQAVEEVENEIFGFDHQEVGSEVLEAWGLPESIYMPIRFHHNHKERPSQYQVPSDILFMSDKIASIYHGTHSATRVQDIKTFLHDGYGMHGENIDNLIDAVANKSIEIFSAFEVSPGNMKPFSHILQEANEELSRLNLSYEQLAMELKQAKERAENLARDLKVANERLSELASRDGLTGLYNHRYFQDAMEKELSRGMRYRRAFSLIMFDLDHFKNINDTYGHPRGDIVLKEVSGAVARELRTSDVVARYGGEEFAIILPETDLKGAAVFAERLRKNIEQKEILADGVTIRITLSIGVTAYVPGSPVEGKAALIVAADQALYNSKKTGRNKVSTANVSA